MSWLSKHLTKYIEHSFVVQVVWMEMRLVQASSENSPDSSFVLAKRIYTRDGVSNLENYFFGDKKSISFDFCVFRNVLFTA